MNPDFPILLEDGPLLAVNKPAGLLTQAPPGIDSLEFRIKRFLKTRDEKPGGVYLGVPHRLDRPVSGAMVFAKHVRAARRISEQFEGRLVKKTYWAMVSGNVTDDSGTWRDYLKKLEDEPRAAVASSDDPAGKPAILHFRTLKRFEDRTHLEIELETGRMHQIRVQCASRGHALLGDCLYGSEVHFGPTVLDIRERLIALHARRLRLKHPMTDAPLDLIAPLNQWWESIGVREEEFDRFA